MLQQLRTTISYYYRFQIDNIKKDLPYIEKPTYFYYRERENILFVSVSIYDIYWLFCILSGCY